MTSETPTILILIGITGDLSKLKLLPALGQLKQKNLLPDRFKLVGVSRRDGADLFKMDLEQVDDYLRLKKYLDDIETEWGTKANRLFYLSVAPKVSLPIIEKLGQTGLSEVDNTKLLLEKPFGLDKKDAEHFLEVTGLHFKKEQVYRVDHYLAKETVRAFKHIEIKDVEHIEICASETVGVDGRESFYEQTGALRDLVQSHLLLVAARIISPADRLGVLKKMYIKNQSDVQRAQYQGYRELIGNPESVVETKVSLKVFYDDISITLKTGKALNKKSTDVFIFYKNGTTEHLSLNDTKNAYEQVFLDAFAGEKNNFVTQEEVLETWRILDPIQEAWKKGSLDLLFYEVGSSI